MSQLSKFMMSASSTSSGRASESLEFSAAMPIYAVPEQTQPTPNPLKFTKHLRVDSLTGAQQLTDAQEEHELASLAAEMDQISEEAFDEAAVPIYQMIQTYDRKNLKMKKHKRKKRKDKMRIKLKWSGKL